MYRLKGYLEGENPGPHGRNNPGCLRVRWLHEVNHSRRAHPRSSVYRALTTEVGLTHWWTKKVQVEERQGGIIRFTFAGDFHPQMKQTLLDSDRRVEWLCVAGHTNWLDNRFTFTLEERKGETLLMFSQDYARELSNEVYGTYNFNWGYYLNSLKLFCEKGVGAPFAPSA